MKKKECEEAIRWLCHEWAKSQGLRGTPDEEPHFEAFYAWVKDNYPRYLRFRTTISVAYDVELWFDQEMKQTWRR